MAEKHMCLKSVYKHGVQDQSVTWLRLDCFNPSSLALKAEMYGIRLIDAYMKENYRCIYRRRLYSLLSFRRTGSTIRSKREPKSHEIVLMHLSGDYLNRNAKKIAIVQCRKVRNFKGISKKDGTEYPTW